MIRKRPFGVTMTGAAFTFIGAVSILLIFFQVIDSIQFHGLASLMITSTSSLLGFVLYVGLPVILYSTGMGLFLLRPWSWHMTVYVIPMLVFFFFFSKAVAIVLSNAPHLANAEIVDLFIYHPTVYLSAFLLYFLLIGPLFYYFTHPVIMAYFGQN